MCSPPGIQLIFAKLSMTAMLTFSRAGTDGMMGEEKNGTGGLVKGRADKSHHGGVKRVVVM